MASSEYSDRQKFISKDGIPLTSLRSHPCITDNPNRYILWTDIQHAFMGIDHLETTDEKRVLFMIDSDDELWHPLGIPYDPAKVYVVIYGSYRGQQAEDSYNTQQESDNQGQGNHHGLVQDEILSSPRDLFDTCMYLYKYQESITEGGRDLFRQAVANTRYYHSMFIEEIKKLHPAGVKASVYGKDQVQILQELRDLEQQVPEWEYRNVCFCTLTDKSIQWRYAVSSLFIALPSDLNLWDNSDPSTHRFQVHFLCDNWKHNGAAGDLPQHVHLSNHPGYSLKYPEEFFQEFGDYVLRVLQMIKSGYTNHLYEIPPLDTTKILWSCDPNPLLTSKNYRQPNGDKILD
ncbi:hypothetical protein CPC16_004226 [Podila verticillata]|nr:hypothetical protein CPC16_004226 [Podila verticillata]